MADVMNPNILWVKGRCYRLYGQSGLTTDVFHGYGDDDKEFVNEFVGHGEDLSDEDYEVEVTENGRMKISFHAPRSLHAVLIGSKGSARQRLEKETKTQIRIPKKGINEDIIVTGPTKDSVVQARRRMELIILAARQKQQFTHFLSLPMNNDTIINGFQQFKEQVLEHCCSRGVGPDIFQDPGKLHLTLGTLALLDEVDRKRAAQALQECKKDVIDPLLAKGSLRLKMCGIEYMNDDPSEVDVLYGRIQDLNEPPVVQDLSDALVKYISKTGLMPKQHESGKLHVTVMNSLFRRKNKDSNTIQTEEGSGRRPRESFDALPILDKFTNFDFGEVVIRSVDLSRRYSTAANGYYEATASVSLS